MNNGFSERCINYFSNLLPILFELILSEHIHINILSMKILKQIILIKQIRTDVETIQNSDRYFLFHLNKIIFISEDIKNPKLVKCSKNA